MPRAARSMNRGVPMCNTWAVVCPCGCVTRRVGARAHAWLAVAAVRHSSAEVRKGRALWVGHDLTDLVEVADLGVFGGYRLTGGSGSQRWRQ